MKARPGLWHCPLALQRQEVLPCQALLQKGRDSFHSGFWIDMVSLVSVLWCPLPVNPSVSPLTSAAVASLNFIYRVTGTFEVGSWLDLQETYNEFELPLSMLSSLWTELFLKIRLPPKVVFFTSIMINCKMLFSKEPSTFCSDFIV